MNKLSNTSILFWLIAFIIIGLFCVGVYLLLLSVFGISSKTRSKNFNKLAIGQNKKINSISAQISLWAKKFENNALIKKMVNPYKREKLVNEFNILGISKSPEEHYAYSLLTCVIFIPVSILIIFFSAIIGHTSIGVAIGIVIILLGVLAGLMELNSVDSMLNKRREKIERELPSFISYVENTLKNDKDIIKMISGYVSEGDTPLIKELKLLLIDLKTGDYEYAFNRFTNRTNSGPVSEVSRGLTACMRGDDTQNYFEMLSYNFWEIEKQRLEKEAMKKPNRVKKLSLLLIGAMFLLYIVVFGTIFLENAWVLS